MLKRLLVAVLVASVLACATPIAGPGVDPRVGTAAKIAVQYATLTAVDRVGSDPATTAAKIVEIVDRGLALAENEPASVGELALQIQAMIPADKLSPQDRYLVAALSELVVSELTRRVPVGEAVPIGDLKVVLGWVRDAALFAAPR